MWGLWFSVVALLAALGITNSQGENDVLVGTLPTLQHRVSGRMFIRDTTTLVIQNFNYDGLGPVTFAYYYPPGVALDRRGGGIIIKVPGSPNSDGSFPFGSRAAYFNQQLTLTMSPGQTVCDIGVFTLWCRPFRAFFTTLTFNRDELFEKTADGSCVLKSPTRAPPATTQLPTTMMPTTLAPTTAALGGVEIGELPNIQHGVSGTLHILDPHTLFIEDFSYDGNAPGAHLYYYSPGQVPDRNGGGISIPVPKTDDGLFDFGRAYVMEDLLIPLPEGTTACDIGTLTIWCEPFRVFFTMIAIEAERVFVQGVDECQLQDGGSSVLPFECPDGKFASSAADCMFDNCLPLHDQLQLSWTTGVTGIDFRLCGCQGTDPALSQYMGFGLSGNPGFTLMFQADPVITWVDELGPHAKDYYLSGYFQCRGNSGACPDTVYDGCSNDVQSVSGSQQGGQQCVIYRRAYNTSDSVCDSELDPSIPQYIVWGVGGISQEGVAFQHFIRASATDPPVLFDRKPVDQCSGVELQCVGCPSFQPAVIEALENATFVVKIGPSGADRGYPAITGQTGWGIAYFINDTLVPELVVQRGRTYTFIIEAGNDKEDQANYHPLYITNDQHGSWLFKSDSDKKAEIVYAGISDDGDPYAAGRLCKCSEGLEASRVRDNCGSREEYEDSLDCTCADGKAAVLTWTPDSKTEDTVYYQCAVHLNLGWRINVQDPPDPCLSFECPSHATCDSYRSPFFDELVPFCVPSCELDNGGCAQDEVCRLISPVPCPFDITCVPEVQCSPIDPCANFSCPSHATCRVFEPTREAYCDPSCQVDNGGCAEGELCSLLATPCAAPPPPRPCPLVVVCSQPTPSPDPCTDFSCPSHATCQVFVPPLFDAGPSEPVPFCQPSCELDNGGCEANQDCELVPRLCPPDSPCPPAVVCSDRDPCVNFSCPSHATCDSYRSPSFDELVPFCVPSCELDNGGCAQDEVCRLVSPVPCPFDIPCVPEVQCSPIDPCANFSCPSHATCRVFEPTREAYCDPSCQVDNGGCAEGELCSLLATPCAAPPPPRPCPLVVVCSQPTPSPDPCADFGCPSHATCQVFTPPLSDAGPSEPVPFCQPSCELDNGGCEANQDCELVPRPCPPDFPCPPAVVCSDRDPCASVECNRGYECRVHTPTNTGYCEPSCEQQNGGCPRGTHCILRKDQECEEGVPCPALRSCCPHPLCDMEFCAGKGNRRAICISPYGSECGQAGGDNCPIAFCHTCYFSGADNELPDGCTECPSYTDNSRCARRWGTCIRRAHFTAYGQAWPRSQRLRVAEDFRCHSPPCKN